MPAWSGKPYAIGQAVIVQVLWLRDENSLFDGCIQLDVLETVSLHALLHSFIREHQLHVAAH